MDTETLKSEIRSLIAKSKTEAAIKLLTEQPLGRLDREAVIIQSQYARVKQDLQLNVISREDAERKINQINLAIIDLAERVGQPTSTPVSSTPNKQWLWLLIIPLVLGIGYMVFPKSRGGTDLKEAKLQTENGTADKETLTAEEEAEPEELKIQFILDKMKVVKDGGNGSDGDFYWDIRVNSQKIDERPEHDDIGLPDGYEYPFDIKKTFTFIPGKGETINLVANISENDDFMNGDDDHLTIIKAIAVDELDFPNNKEATFREIGTHEDGPHR
jgi:hypothetical protein